MYLLDTNAWPVFLNGRSRSVLDRIQSTPPNELLLSAIVWAELLYGWNAKGRPRKLGLQLEQLLDRYDVLDFDASCADAYGPVRSDLEAAGSPIGLNDFLIAATALSNGLILVTHNTKEFLRVPGLRVEDWQTDDPPKS